MTRFTTTFTLITLVVIVASTFVSWVALVPIIAFLLFRILPDATTSEGPFSVAILTSGLSLILTPLGLVPAYWLSMKLAEYLRNKRGWEIRHPRRLFVLALVLPILLLVISAAFLRQS